MGRNNCIAAYVRRSLLVLNPLDIRRLTPFLRWTLRRRLAHRSVMAPKLSSCQSASFLYEKPKAGKTNRHYYTCNHCSSSIEHQESALLNHLIDRCTDAPEEVKSAARTELAAKRGATAATAPVIAVKRVLADSQVDGIDPGAVPEPVPKKKCLVQTGMLEFADKPMSVAQKFDTDLALVRCARHSCSSNPC
jgi:hypothetical protein